MILGIIFSMGNIAETTIISTVSEPLVLSDCATRHVSISEAENHDNK
jgi:hypothetical protein